MKKLLSLFLSKDFTCLFSAQMLGSFNDNLLRTAFATFITFKIASLSPEESVLFVPAALLFYALPFFLFSVLAGEVADKYSKTKVIRVVKFSEVITALFAAAGFYIQNPYFLLFVLFLMGGQSAFLAPVKYSFLPQTIKRQQLIGANGLMEAGRYVAIFLGTLIGTFLIAEGGREGINWVNWLMIIVAAAGFWVTLFFNADQAAAPSLKISGNIIKSTWRGVNKVYRSKTIFLCVLAISWFWVLGGVMLSQLPDISANILHANSKVFNYLLGVFAFGICAGALLCRKLLKGEISVKYLPLSTVLMSVALADMAFVIALLNPAADVLTFKSFISTFTGVRLSVDLFIIALCAGFYIVPLNAMLQTIGTDAMRSRIIAANNVINYVFMVLAGTTSIILLSLGAGTAVIIGILAISNLVIAVYICKLLPDYVLRSALYFILNTLYDIRVQGFEHYQRSAKRTLIIANNNSFLDPLLIAAFLPDDITFVVDSNIAKRFWVRIFLKFVDHFPVDPTNPMAVKSIIDEIKKGRRVVIFPEGRISTTGAVMKIYPGPAMIADRSGAEILPICIQGTQYSRLAYFGRKLRHLPKHVEFVVNILPPVQLNLKSDLKGKDRRMSAEDKVYDLMTDMHFRSTNNNATLFRSLIEAADLAGRGSRALEDIQRKGLTFGTLLTGSFLLGRKFAAFTKEAEYTGVLLPNVNACAVSIFGLMAYGRVPAMINFSSGIKNILSSCRAAQLKTIITSKMFIHKAEMESVVKDIEAAGLKIVYLEDIQKTINIVDKLRALAQSNFPYFSYRHTDKNRTPYKAAVVLFTSGSEGVPKGVVLSHKNINANRHQLLSIINFGLQDKFFNALPMFHSFGLVCGLFMPLLSGSSVFLYPSPLHYKIVPELVYDRNATVFFGTDTFLSAYAKNAHPYDFYNIRIAAIGAEKLKDETFKMWSEKFGIRVLEAYGATETSPGISFTTPMHFKRGTVGRIFPGLDHRLEPVEGLEEGGRLIVKGDNVMMGYLKEDNPGVLQPPQDGWYDTGDIVTFDEEGYITIRGRAKRFAKIAGEMISLTAVEMALHKIWPDHLTAVVRLPDAKRGEQLLVYTSNPQADLKQVQQAFREQGYSELWIPKKIEIVEAVPLMPNGKVDYVKLDEMAQKYINQD